MLNKGERKLKEMKQLSAEVEEISRALPDVERDTIRHILLLLREKPITRLRMALRRGQSMVRAGREGRGRSASPTANIETSKS